MAFATAIGIRSEFPSLFSGSKTPLLMATAVQYKPVRHGINYLLTLYYYIVCYLSDSSYFRTKYDRLFKSKFLFTCKPELVDREVLIVELAYTHRDAHTSTAASVCR